MSHYEERLERDLSQIKQQVALLAGLVEKALDNAVHALLADDDQLAYVYSKRDDALAMLMVEPDVFEFQAKVVDARNKPKGRAAAANTSKAPAGRRRAA